jgi:hypothetical protein
MPTQYVSLLLKEFCWAQSKRVSAVCARVPLFLSRFADLIGPNKIPSAAKSPVRTVGVCARAVVPASPLIRPNKIPSSIGQSAPNSITPRRKMGVRDEEDHYINKVYFKRRSCRCCYVCWLVSPALCAREPCSPCASVARSRLSIVD